MHLNLDLNGDHGPYCGKYPVRKAWYTIFEARGWEIVDVMQACPKLEYVALLYHGIPYATWVEFHPPRCAEPRLVLEYDQEHECVD